MAAAAARRSWVLPRLQVILFGDSITQQSSTPNGWSNLLDHWYSRKADVINRGYSGYNTEWALWGLKQLVPTDTAVPARCLVLVCLGANDAALPTGPAAFQHIPVDTYATNLKAIIGVFQAAAGTRLLLMTPPPIDEEARQRHFLQQHGGWTSNDRRCTVTAEYAEACRQVGQELNIPVVDLWFEPDAAERWKARLSDGLHLNSDGDAVVFDALTATLRKELPDLTPEALPLDLPLYTDLPDAMTWS